MLQPLVIRPIDNGRYEIIAGERRFRAAALAQLKTVPVIIKEVSDENTLALALIEKRLVTSGRASLARARGLISIECSMMKVGDRDRKSVV